MISLAAALLAAASAVAQQTPAPPTAVVSAEDCKRLNRALDRLYEAQTYSNRIEQGILTNMGMNTTRALADAAGLRASLQQSEDECSQRILESLNFEPQLQQLSQAVSAARSVCPATDGGRSTLPARELDGSCAKAASRAFELDVALAGPADSYKNAGMSCSPAHGGIATLLAPLKRPCERPGYCDARARLAAADRLHKAWKDEISKFKAPELVQLRGSLYPLFHYAEGIYGHKNPAGLEKEHFNSGANIAASRQLVMTAMDVGRCK